MSAPIETLQLCAFAVGSRECVIDVMRVRTITRPLPVTAVPHAPPFVEGVIEMRGSVIPVVDLRRRLEVPAAPLGPKARMIVIRTQGREVALLVDQVLEVMQAKPEDISEVPPLLVPSAAGARFFLGVCQAGTPPRLRLLVNVKALLASDALPETLVVTPGPA